MLIYYATAFIFSDKMKGISPVIATILLLLITVAIVGIAFNFFTQTTSTTTQQVQDTTEQQLNQFGKQISLEAITNDSVTLRGTGSSSIPGNEIQVYVDGAVRTCSPAMGTIAPQQVQTCTFSPECTTGQEIKATSPANSVTETCP